MQRSAWLRIAPLAVGAATLLGACLGATQITVHVTTDATCALMPGQVHFVTLGVAAGVPGKVDPTAPAGISTSCGALVEGLGAGYGPSDLGTLALVPGASKDGPLEVVVVASIESTAEPAVALSDCLTWAVTQKPDANHRNLSDPGTLPVMPCIVARRSLTFTEHESFELPIQLDATCEGVDCGPGFTCSNQKCVKQATTCPRGGGACGLGGAGGAMTSSTTNVSTSVSSTVAATTASVTSTASNAASTSTGCNCSVMTNCVTAGLVCQSTNCACLCTNDAVCSFHCMQTQGVSGACVNSISCSCFSSTTSSSSSSSSGSSGG